MRQQDLGGLLIDRFADGADIGFGISRLLIDADEPMIDELIAIYGDRHIDVAKRTLRLSMHSFLVRTRHHTILIDTCLGAEKERPARPAFHHRQTSYLQDLAALGVSPEQIDFVMCTHMHSDHTGWNTRLRDGRWVPTFPNARYIMAQAEYDHWAACGRVEPPDVLLHGSFADSVLPVVEAGQAVMVNEDDFICDGVRIEYFVGHSPGNVAVILEGGQGDAICTGDIVHSPIQFHFPTLRTGCPDPEQARESRLRLYDRIADTPTLMLPAHFQDPSAGRLRREGARFRYDWVD